MKFEKITLIALIAVFFIAGGYSFCEADCRGDYDKKVQKCNKFQSQAIKVAQQIDKTAKKIDSTLKKKPNADVSKLTGKLTNLEKQMNEIPPKFDKCMDDAEDELLACFYKAGNFASGWNKNKFDTEWNKIEKDANTAREHVASCLSDCKKYWDSMNDMFVQGTIDRGEYHKANENWLSCTSECTKGHDPGQYEKKKKALIKKALSD